MTTAHIINHTHWDREWFLTHEYTTAWVPDLIDSLVALTGDNPEYEFLIDGQSLVIEDLLSGRPDYLDAVQRLVGKGNLVVGPLYSQPDWRMVSGELHLRNLRHGLDDAASLGGAPDVAWLVDTFGHISQAPQMLALAGIDTAFVWRGVPAMTPLFSWEGADGSRVATIDLFGGYRNLYGVTKTAEIAVDRLVAEVDKLSGSYGEIPIPLFDGYDLDTEPEDPIRFYEGLDLPDRITIEASSPRRYADAIRPFLNGAPTISGELLSGKYGATFPGSLSARTYLKVLHSDAERALFRRVEPLATLAAVFGVTYDSATYESIARELLQNGVHDCLCGVSIDQVHERMERSYRRIIDWADTRQQILASSILGGFASGRYALSTNPLPNSAIVRTATRAMRVDTQGIGVSPVAEAHPVRSIDRTVERIEWTNDHYSAVIDESGLRVDGQPLLRLLVRADDGDTYSSEPGSVLGELELIGAVTHVDETDIDTRVRWNLGFTGESIDVTATLVAHLGDGPIIGLTIELDSTGSRFRVDAEFSTGIAAPTVRAGMPFDVVERHHDDDDLLGPTVDPELASILMGQRETGRVTEFPFHDVVAMSSGERAGVVLAQGIRSYRSRVDGVIAITLRRSVEWLALTDLTLRSGDAGPAMYVPGARSERIVNHHLGYAPVDGPCPNDQLAALSEGFHNPPIVAEVDRGDPEGHTAPTEWAVFDTPVPATALFQSDGHASIRIFKPSIEPVELPAPLSRLSLRGVDLGSIESLRPKEIVTTAVDLQIPAGWAPDPGRVSVLTPLTDRGGRSRSRPDPNELEALGRRISELEVDLEAVIDRLGGATGPDRWIQTHQQYVVERELLELRLSFELNRRRAATDAEVSIPDEADPEIAELGARLNDLRVKRRIFDYVVQALAGS